MIMRLPLTQGLQLRALRSFFTQLIDFGAKLLDDFRGAAAGLIELVDQRLECRTGAAGAQREAQLLHHADVTPAIEQDLHCHRCTRILRIICSLLASHDLGSGGRSMSCPLPCISDMSASTLPSIAAILSRNALLSPDGSKSPR
jgi:hypothetical protein